MLKKRKEKFLHLGLLILRIGLGGMLLLHGYPKLFGGPDAWANIGTATQSLGIDFIPMFFGFMAGITEFFGGLFLIFGLFFRTALSFLIIEMFVATMMHLAAGDPFGIYSHSIEIGIVFISLLFIGSGKFSLDKKLTMRRRRRY